MILTHEIAKLEIERQIMKLQQELERSTPFHSTPRPELKPHIQQDVPRGWLDHTVPLPRLLSPAPSKTDQKTRQIRYSETETDRKQPERDQQYRTTTDSKHMKPATYDGTKSWNDQEAHFDAYAELNKWSDEQKGLYLSVSLRGQAQCVFGNLSTKSTEYSELIRALEDRFSPANQTELYRVQLKARRQKATESMGVRETLAKERFIDVLINSYMRLGKKQARPTNSNDAVRHAVKLEAYYRAERKH